MIAFVDRTNRAILEALLELKRNGTFKDNTYLIIWYSDSGSGIMNDSAKALNTHAVYEEYASAFK